MADLKDDVTAALGKISSPDGAPLPVTGKLSEIVASDGKVFLSITVDAGAVKDWEAVRERAEAAVRAVPGVQSVMIALTAERAGTPSLSSPASGGGKGGGPPHPEQPASATGAASARHGAAPGGAPAPA